MGNTTSIRKIGFEDMKYVIKNKKKNRSQNHAISTKKGITKLK